MNKLKYNKHLTCMYSEMGIKVGHRCHSERYLPPGIMFVECGYRSDANSTNGN